MVEDVEARELKVMSDHLWVLWNILRHHCRDQEDTNVLQEGNVLDLECHLHHIKSMYRHISRLMGVQLQDSESPLTNIVNESLLSLVHAKTNHERSRNPSPWWRQWRDELKPVFANSSPSCGKGGGHNNQVNDHNGQVNDSLQWHSKFPASSSQLASMTIPLPNDLNYYKPYLVV